MGCKGRGIGKESKRKKNKTKQNKTKQIQDINTCSFKYQELRVFRLFPIVEVIVRP